MAELLKNIFFTTGSINHLAESLKKVYPEFNHGQFKNCIYSASWEKLELKQKMRHVSTCLKATLPDDYIQAVEILEKTAPEITGFDAMVLPDFVEQYGLDHFDRSLQALAWFTRFSSSEFAIRPFLNHDLPKVIEWMNKLSESDQEGVRRFASEGCRPRLPWAMSVKELQKDPSSILPILERLKDDPSEMVRRSVANNLNDISRDHPDLVIEICRKWMGNSSRTDKLIKQALRTVLKEGRTEALRLFGFGDPDHIEIISFSLEKESPRIGDSTGFELVFMNMESSPVMLRLEYGIFYRKKNGSLSKKIFQITEKTHAPGTHTIRRKLTFQDMTTRTHYPGEHQIAVFINGREMTRSAFILTPA